MNIKHEFLKKNSISDTLIPLEVKINDFNKFNNLTWSSHITTVFISFSSLSPSFKSSHALYLSEINDLLIFTIVIDTYKYIHFKIWPDEFLLVFLVIVISLEYMLHYLCTKYELCHMPSINMSWVFCYFDLHTLHNLS